MLIKATCLAIPTYVMRSIALPKAVCFRINAKIRRFWWGTKDDNSIPLCCRAWDSLCVPKSFGGLGLCRSINMNRTLLGSWCWSLISGNTSFFFSVLRGKCLRDTTFQLVMTRPTDLLFWKSIVAVKELILKGICIQAGEGTRVNI